MKKDNRLEIIRIIAIICVMILHISNRMLIHYDNLSNVNTSILIVLNAITRISVPLFFMISGVVNIPKEYNSKKYFTRIFRMIIVLSVWTVVYYFIQDYKFSYLIQAFFSSIKPHLWYMYALIGLYIATPFISKMVKNLTEEEEKLYIKLYLIICGVYCLFKIITRFLGINSDIDYPIPLFNAAYYLGYYILGYLIYKNYDKSIKFDKSSMHILTIICFIINSILTIVVTLNKGTYYRGFFSYQNILIIMPSLLIFIMLLHKIKDKEYKVVNVVCPYIFGIYLSHVMILDYLMHTIKFNNIYLSFGTYLILTFILSYTLCFILKKIPYLNKYLC